MQDVALRASSRLTGSVAEVLIKCTAVLLHTGCGAAVARIHLTVDDVEACLPLIQPQLEVGSARPWEVLITPLNIEDPIRCCALHRGEDPKPTEYRIQVIPVGEDGVRRITGGRQALVDERRDVSDEGGTPLDDRMIELNVWSYSV